MNTYINKPAQWTGAILISIFSVSGFAQGNDAAKAEKNSIDAQYKSAMAQCKAMNGNAKDVCEKEAKGHANVAKAELQARVKPSDSNSYKARLARAEADHDVAKERCDDLSGNAKDVCKKDAEAAFVKAKEDAKVKRVQEGPGSPSGKAADVSEARKDASAATRDAEYKAAKERCDTLSGSAKDVCVNDAKTRYGQ